MALQILAVEAAEQVIIKPEWLRALAEAAKL
jgi:hypothetical protein